MSVSTPIYSALGRIRKCVLLEPDAENFPIHFERLNEPENAAVKELADAYRGITRLLTEKAVNLVIVFSPPNKDVLKQDFLFSNDGMLFLAPQKIYTLGHQWVQDLIHFVPGLDKEYYVRRFNVNNDGILDGVVLESLQNADLLPGELNSNTGKSADGGNILRGRNNGKDYIIIGQKEHCQLTRDELSVFFNIKPERIYFCPTGKPGSQEREVLYHLDLYAMLGGTLCWKKSIQSKIKKKGEVVFFAEFIGTGADSYNKAIKKSISGLKRQTKEFEIDFLPAILLNGKVYSYCNCLVENYKLLNGTRKVAFYFPDFTDNFETIELTIFEKNKINLLIKNINLLQKNKWLNKKRSIKNSYLSATNLQVSVKNIQNPQCDLKQTAITIQENIRQHLIYRYGIEKNDIHFIKNRFPETTDLKAGLHCLVKVIERDRVDLNC